MVAHRAGSGFVGPDGAAQTSVQTRTLRPAAVDLADLPSTTLSRLAAAGAEACEWEEILARTGDNVVGELLQRHGVFREWEHCPRGDVYDPRSRSQYYYHAHARAERAPNEHGHFHVFLRGLPSDMPPSAQPSGAMACMPAGQDLTHLVGLSMDRNGHLIRLFTTNRWVTGETWRPAEDVIAMLEWFNVGHARPSWPTNRWITAVVDLFRPQIEALVRARDGVVEAWRLAHPGRDALDDRELSVTSEMWTGVADQLRAVAQARGH